MSKPDAADAASDDPGHGPSVPAKMRAQHDAVVALTDAFCRDRLDAECAALCRRLAGALARKRPSPLASGGAAGWACGVARTVVWVNYLDDPERTPHVKSAAVDKAFGVSPATGFAKAKRIRDLLKIGACDPDWTLPSKLADNPIAWLVQLNNGLILDARSLPRHVQEDAAARGLIPYVPDDGPPGASQPNAGPPNAEPQTAGPPGRSRTRRGTTARSSAAARGATTGGRGTATAPRLYTLDVFLTAAPIGERFAKANPVVLRTIQIRGDQTLADLHRAIFDAFGRFDEHMYEFQFGKGPMDPAGPRYVLPMAADDDAGDGTHPVAGRVDQTAIGSLGLTVGRSFEYWFDFGDDWWHQIDVMAVDEAIPPGRYPRVTQRVGADPPQYMEEDEDDDDDE